MRHTGASEQRQPHQAAAADDAGFSFVETVVTVVLLAMVIAPLMSAVIASVKVSSLSRTAAQAETAMINAADRINRANLACDYDGIAEAMVQYEGWPANSASVREEWYDAQTNAWVYEGPDGNGCQFGEPTSTEVQRVTVTITSPDNKITRTIQVVKSNV
jgi:type II secretory pathway pseudopilin PulG